MTVIAPLDSRLKILNPVNHFSTHLRPAKEKPYEYTFALIILLRVHLQVIVLHDHHLHIHALLLCALGAITPCHHAPSSHVLLCLTQNTQHNGISNLVSLITKTKLELSDPHDKWHRELSFLVRWIHHLVTTDHKLLLPSKC
jgi:hypothetical protein